jgi:hypothetical protein
VGATGCQIRPIGLKPKPQRTLPRLIAHTQQVVRLPQGLRRAFFVQRRLASRRSSPSLRRARRAGMASRRSLWPFIGPCLGLLKISIARIKAALVRVAEHKSMVCFAFPPCPPEPTPPRTARAVGSPPRSHKAYPKELPPCCSCSWPRSGRGEPSGPILKPIGSAAPVP